MLENILCAPKPLLIYEKLMARDIVNLTDIDIAHLKVSYAGIIDEEDLNASLKSKIFFLSIASSEPSFNSLRRLITYLISFMGENKKVDVEQVLRVCLMKVITEELP